MKLEDVAEAVANNLTRLRLAVRKEKLLPQQCLTAAHLFTNVRYDACSQGKYGEAALGVV